jgi:hypothetical protein
VRPTRADEGRSNTSEDCVPVIRKDSTLNFERHHEPLDNALSDLGCFHFSGSTGCVIYLAGSARARLKCMSGLTHSQQRARRRLLRVLFVRNLSRRKNRYSSKRATLAHGEQARQEHTMANPKESTIKKAIIAIEDKRSKHLQTVAKNSTRHVAGFLYLRAYKNPTNPSGSL